MVHHCWYSPYGRQASAAQAPAYIDYVWASNQDLAFLPHGTANEDLYTNAYIPVQNATQPGNDFKLKKKLQKTINSFHRIQH